MQHVLDAGEVKFAQSFELFDCLEPECHEFDNRPAYLGFVSVKKIQRPQKYPPENYLILLLVFESRKELVLVLVQLQAPLPKVINDVRHRVEKLFFIFLLLITCILNPISKFDFKGLEDV